MVGEGTPPQKYRSSVPTIGPPALKVITQQIPDSAAPRIGLKLQRTVESRLAANLSCWQLAFSCAASPIRNFLRFRKWYRVEYLGNTTVRGDRFRRRGSSYDRRWSLAKRTAGCCSGGYARHRTRAEPERRDYSFAHNKGESGACTTYGDPAGGGCQQGAATRRPQKIPGGKNCHAGR